MNILFSVALLLATTAGAVRLAGAAPNYSGKPDIETNGSGEVFAAGNDTTADPPLRETMAIACNEDPACVNESVRWRSKRNTDDNWQASLTEEERGGLDTILMQNLGEIYHHDDILYKTRAFLFLFLFLFFFLSPVTVVSCTISVKIP